MKAYAGIGSRKTPDSIQDKMVKIGHDLALQGYTLRSGSAIGADMSFEAGCDFVNGSKEIYLPKKGFNQSDSDLYHICPKAIEIAKKYHPDWSALKPSGQLLMARNSYQVLGLDLESPVDFVVCWTETGGMVGGTGQAMRIAWHYKIPIYNLFHPQAIGELYARN